MKKIKMKRLSALFASLMLLLVFIGCTDLFNHKTGDKTKVTYTFVDGPTSKNIKFTEGDKTLLPSYEKAFPDKKAPKGKKFVGWSPKPLGETSGSDAGFVKLGTKVTVGKDAKKYRPVWGNIFTKPVETVTILDNSGKAVSDTGIEIELKHNSDNDYLLGSLVGPKGADPSVTWSLENPADAKYVDLNPNTGEIKIKQSAGNFAHNGIKIIATSDADKTKKAKVIVKIKKDKPLIIDLTDPDGNLIKPITPAISVKKGEDLDIGVSLSDKDGKTAKNSLNIFDFTYSPNNGTVEAVLVKDPKTGEITGIKVKTKKLGGPITITVNQKDADGNIVGNPKVIKITVTNDGGYAVAVATVEVVDKDDKPIADNKVSLKLAHDGKNSYDLNVKVGPVGSNPKVEWYLDDASDADYVELNDKTGKITVIDGKNFTKEIRVWAKSREDESKKDDVVVSIVAAPAATVGLKDADTNAIVDDVSDRVLVVQGKSSSVEIELSDGNGNELAECLDSFKVESADTSIVTAEIIKNADGLPVSIKLTGDEDNVGTSKITLTQTDFDGNETITEFTAENKNPAGFSGDVKNVEILDKDSQSIVSDPKAVRLNLADAKEYQLHRKVASTNAEPANPAVTWALTDSSDEDYVELDDTGLILVKSGKNFTRDIEVKITSDDDTSKTDTVVLKIVKAPPVTVTVKDEADDEVTATSNPVKIQQPAEEADLSIELSDETDNSFEVSCEPADLAIVSIKKDADGKVDGIKVEPSTQIGSGTVTITQKDSDGNIVSTQTFKIENRDKDGYLQEVTSVEILDENENSLTAPKTINVELKDVIEYQLHKKVFPNVTGSNHKDGANPKVKWELVDTNDSDYVDLDDTGKITFKKNVTRSIKVKITSEFDETKTDTVTLNLQEDQTPATLTLRKTDGSLLVKAENDANPIEVAQPSTKKEVKIELDEDHKDTNNSFEVSCDPEGVASVSVRKDSDGNYEKDSDGNLIIDIAPGANLGLGTVTLVQKNKAGQVIGVSKAFKVKNFDNAGHSVDLTGLNIVDKNNANIAGSPKKITMNLDESLEYDHFNVKAKPDGANPLVTWKLADTSNSDIIAVSASGKVTVKKNVKRLGSKAIELIATTITGAKTIKDSVFVELKVNPVDVKLMQGSDDVDPTKPIIVTTGEDLYINVKHLNAEPDAIKDSLNTFDVICEPADIANVSIEKDAAGKPVLDENGNFVIKSEILAKYGQATITLQQKDDEGTVIATKTFKIDNQMTFAINLKSDKFATGKTVEDLGNATLKEDAHNKGFYEKALSVGDNVTIPPVDVLEKRKSIINGIEAMRSCSGWKNTLTGDTYRGGESITASTAFNLKPMWDDVDIEAPTDHIKPGEDDEVVVVEADVLDGVGTYDSIEYLWSCKQLDESNTTTAHMEPLNKKESKFILDSSGENYDAIRPQAFKITLITTVKKGSTTTIYKKSTVMDILGNGLDADMPVAGSDMGNIVLGKPELTDGTVIGGATGYSSVPVTQEGIDPASNGQMASSIVNNYKNFGGVFINGRDPVKLTPFVMGKTEITNKLWKFVRDETNGSYSFGKGSSDKNDDKPVSNVSWLDSIVFCNAYTSIVKGLGPNERIYVDKSNNSVITSTDDLVGTNVEMKMERHGFRLPTEAEWEYSARFYGKEYPGQGYDDSIVGDSDTFYFNRIDAVSGSNETIHSQARNYLDSRLYAWAKEEKYQYANNSDFEGVGPDYNVVINSNGTVSYYNAKLFNPGKKAAVTLGANDTDGSGEIKPNKLGLYHMSGNVAEWCFDRRVDDFKVKSVDNDYRKTIEINGVDKTVILDPYGANTGTKRMARGGSYKDDMWDGSVGQRRHTYEPNHTAYDIGLRLVFRPKPFNPNE